MAHDPFTSLLPAGAGASRTVVQAVALVLAATLVGCATKGSHSGTDGSSYSTGRGGTGAGSVAERRTVPPAAAGAAQVQPQAMPTGAADKLVAPAAVRLVRVVPLVVRVVPLAVWEAALAATPRHCTATTLLVVRPDRPLAGPVPVLPAPVVGAQAG